MSSCINLNLLLKNSTNIKIFCKNISEIFACTTVMTYLIKTEYKFKLNKKKFFKL